MRGKSVKMSSEIQRLSHSIRRIEIKDFIVDFFYLKKNVNNLLVLLKKLLSNLDTRFIKNSYLLYK